MEDIVELIIKIPEELYQMCRSCLGDADCIESAIANGTPLPKGHGKIVDANRVLENGDNWEVETALMQTEAIIEADSSAR